MTKTLLLNAVTWITTFTRLHLSWPHLGAQRCSDDDAICRDSQGPTQQHQLRQLDPYHHDDARNKAQSQGIVLRFQDELVNFRNLNALFKDLKKKSFDIICNVPRDERTHWAKGRGGHEDSNAAQRCHLCISKQAKFLGFEWNAPSNVVIRCKKYLISRPTCSPFKAPAERGKFDHHKWTIHSKLIRSQIFQYT